jgi:hypothetical protein
MKAAPVAAVKNLSNAVAKKPAIRTGFFIV